MTTKGGGPVRLSVHAQCVYTDEYSVYKRLPGWMSFYKKKKMCPHCATCGAYYRNLRVREMFLREENAKIH